MLSLCILHFNNSRKSRQTECLSSREISFNVNWENKELIREIFIFKCYLHIPHILQIRPLKSALLKFAPIPSSEYS